MSVFDKAAKVVGDLDNPFYAEERQRDVWNEASAVGYQTLIWGALALACAMAWFGAEEVRPWTLALLIVTGIGSFAAILYANRRGVRGTENVRMLRPRTFLAVALALGTFAGLVVRGGGDFSASTLAGGVVGAGVALAGMTLAQRRALRGQD